MSLMREIAGADPGPAPAYPNDSVDELDVGTSLCESIAGKTGCPAPFRIPSAPEKQSEPLFLVVIE